MKIFTAILLTGLSFETICPQSVNKSKLDSLFNILAEKNKAMGSLTISKNGTVLYTKTIGYRFISDNEKIPSTLSQTSKSMLRIIRFIYLLIKTDPFFILPFSSFNI
jgi:hypothetical protein